MRSASDLDYKTIMLLRSDYRRGVHVSVLATKYHCSQNEVDRILSGYFNCSSDWKDLRNLPTLKEPSGKYKSKG